MQVLRSEALRRGLAEYGSPSLCWRVRVETSIGGGGVGVGGGSGESEADRLWKGAAAGCSGVLVFLTWTDDGWSEHTCFSRDRICRKTSAAQQHESL